MRGLASSTSSARGIAAIVGVGPKLGRSIARKFAHEGYTVAILARDLGICLKISYFSLSTLINNLMWFGLSIFTQPSYFIFLCFIFLIFSPFPLFVWLPGKERKVSESN